MDIQYRRYLVPSFHFKLAANATTKCIKSWLGLSRSTSVAVIHHPAVMDIPFLPSFSAKAKISYLSSITLSKDPLVNEIASLSNAPSFKAAMGVPEDAVNVIGISH